MPMNRHSTTEIFCALYVRAEASSPLAARYSLRSGVRYTTHCAILSALHFA